MITNSKIDIYKNIYYENHDNNDCDPLLANPVCSSFIIYLLSWVILKSTGLLMGWCLFK